MGDLLSHSAERLLDGQPRISVRAGEVLTESLRVIKASGGSRACSATGVP